MIENVEKLKEKVLKTLEGSNVALIKIVLNDIFINIETLCTYNPTKINEKTHEVLEEKKEQLNNQKKELDVDRDIRHVMKFRKSKKKNISEISKLKEYPINGSWIEKTIYVAREFPQGFTANEIARKIADLEGESLDNVYSSVQTACSRCERVYNTLLNISTNPSRKIYKLSNEISNDNKAS